MSRILVVEDDVEINGLISRVLKNNGYDVDCAFSGTEGMMLIERYDYDLMILDLMLPGMTGEEIIGEVRRSGKLMPIIVASAKIGMNNKVNVLKMGADDFMTKPFDNDEILARVETHLRRYGEYNVKSQARNIFKVRNISLDRDLMEVRVCDQVLPLTVIEYKILELLMTNPKKVFTKETLFRTIWNDDYYGNDNTVNVHISNLRGKLAKSDPDNDYIKTVWGIGFKLVD